MIDFLLEFEHVALWLVWVGVALATFTTAAVVVSRIALAWDGARRNRIARRYGPVLGRALHGDGDALHTLVTSPSRYRIIIARLLLAPLIEDRDAGRIAATRAIFRALSLVPVADRFLRSHWWWRRSVALRALGLVQVKDHTGEVVAALDDPNADVRGAALDALADMQNPAALPAVVVRLHDASLQRGRRAAVLAAFGSECEAFLLDLSQIDPEHRLNYARALAICGTERSRPALCQWTDDARMEVRAAAFEGLAHVGLDDHAASLAVRALESSDAAVRAMAATALHDWTGPGDAASRLAAHLDDTWTVAVRAARSLQSMHQAGRDALQPYAVRSDLAGVLARQMLWEVETQL